MWDLPRPGLEPVSPALAGRFSTTAPPGKPQITFKIPLKRAILQQLLLSSQLDDVCAAKKGNTQDLPDAYSGGLFGGKLESRGTTHANHHSINILLPWSWLEVINMIEVKFENHLYLVRSGPREGIITARLKGAWGIHVYG